MSRDDDQTRIFRSDAQVSDTSDLVSAAPPPQSVCDDGIDLDLDPPGDGTSLFTAPPAAPPAAPLAAPHPARTTSPGSPDSEIDLDVAPLSEPPAAGPLTVRATTPWQETPYPISGGKTLAPGELINNRFCLESLLGMGGMGMVYLARDLRKEELGDTDSQLAIKLLSSQVRHLPNALYMLQQECKKAQGLAHPNVVTVYDFDRDGDIVYMTMELLKGQSLSEYMAARPAAAPTEDFSEPLAIITDIVAGLSYAHHHGIVHFDLKPGNIFITESGTTKILDFGIARAVRTSASDPQKSHADADGMIALTPAYASLEMLRGMLPDPRDDVYALAIISYQLLSGRHPFDELSAIDALHQKRKPARIAGLSERQWKGLQAGLALSRDERTLSAELFLQALLPKRVDPRYRLAVGAALLAVAVSVYFWLQPPQIVAPSLFDNPPPVTALAAADQARVDDLLALAEVHQMVGRLVSPVGANALDVYQQVLDIHPYDRRAIAGLKGLLVSLSQAAEQAMADGEWHRAEGLVESGLKIHPQHTQLRRLKLQIIEKKT